MRTPRTIGTRTDCAYCRARITARAAMIVNARLRTTMMGFASGTGSAAKPSVSGGVTTTVLGCFDGSTWLCTGSPISHDEIVPQYIGSSVTMDVSDFDFDLPDELIAQQAPVRGASRLLVLDRSTGTRRHTAIAELPSILAPGDVLVVNNTRVLAARLLGHRVPGGGAVECLLLGPTKPEAPLAGTRDQPARKDEADVRIADALVHPGQKLKPGSMMRFEGEAGALVGEIVARHFHGRRTIRLWVEGGGDVDALVDALGHMPLPPYIRRGDTLADRDRYQTVYARVRGSVAAPTAGLHFTPELLSAIDDRGVERIEITLHVGY